MKSACSPNSSDADAAASDDDADADVDDDDDDCDEYDADADDDADDDECCDCWLDRLMVASCYAVFSRTHLRKVSTTASINPDCLRELWRAN